MALYINPSPLRGEEKVEGEFLSPRGIEAKEYVERRFAENGNQMIIETRKLGKWRRWLAKVYLPDTGRTLNEELVERDLAKKIRAHAGGG